jgi:hypothetical protein
MQSTILPQLLYEGRKGMISSRMDGVSILGLQLVHFSPRHPATIYFEDVPIALKIASFFLLLLTVMD